MKKVKSVFFKGTVALLMLGAISIPAHAATSPLPSGNPLSQVMNQLNQQLNSLQDYLNKTVAAQLQPLSESLGKDIEQVVSEATGALGLPDPAKYRTEVEKAAAASDNPVNSVEQATNEVDRLLTRAAINATLGEDGQLLLQQQAQQTQNSVIQVAQQAQAAQQAVSTQDVVKAMAQQNAQISSVLGSLRADSLQATQNQQLTNLNLTNISRSLDGQNQAKQSEVVGTGLDTFRTAARARLF